MEASLRLTRTEKIWAQIKIVFYNIPIEHTVDFSEFAYTTIVETNLFWKRQ